MAQQIMFQFIKKFGLYILLTVSIAATLWTGNIKDNRLDIIRYNSAISNFKILRIQQEETPKNVIIFYKNKEYKVYIDLNRYYGIEPENIPYYHDPEYDIVFEKNSLGGAYFLEKILWFATFIIVWRIFLRYLIEKRHPNKYRR